ncbi:MAG: hypothetical protein FJ267_02400 [Planctomycetes bacterium]|nr:hypothetical protein [Planctomycetota bacterium]
MKYLISGVNPSGTKETLSVEADTPGDAVRDLKSQGYTDVAIHSDDFMGTIDKQFARMSGQDIDQKVTAKDQVAFQSMSQFGFFLHLLKKGFPFFTILIVIVRRFMDIPWGEFDYVFTGITVYLLGVVIYYSFFSSKRHYDRLIYLCSWYRWEEALQVIPKLQGKIPPLELAIRECSALAGLGRLDKALKKFEKFSRQPDVPKWMYYGQLSTIFYSAGLPDRINESQEKAYEESPENSTIAIDLATSLVRFKKDIVRAKSLLSKIDRDGLSEVPAAGEQVVLGLIAIEEKKPQKAISYLNDVRQTFERYAVANAMSAWFVDTIHAYLCLAHALNNDFEAARSHFAKAEPRLKVFTLKDILLRCQRALGEPVA